MRPGTADAHTIVELSPDAWTPFAWELKTCFALLYADQLTRPPGSLARWPAGSRRSGWPRATRCCSISTLPFASMTKRAALSTWTTASPSGTHRRRSWDFLHRTGFVHLRGVLDAGEVNALTSDVALAVERARPDDRKSCWTTVDRREVGNRVNYLNETSERVAALGADHRFVAIAALGDPALRDAHDRLDGNRVVIKVPSSSGSLADLPWHRDCGMGGHSVNCPMLNVGIQLDAATAENGQLEMIPGSHRGTSRLPSAREAAGHPVVALTTEPGDVTVHFGHTLHAAPPPRDPDASGRRRSTSPSAATDLRDGRTGAGLQRRALHQQRRPCNTSTSSVERNGAVAGREGGATVLVSLQHVIGEHL